MLHNKRIMSDKMKNKKMIIKTEIKIIEAKRGNNFQYLRRRSIVLRNSNLIISDFISNRF
jgi:hypothetical protein